MEKTKIEWCDSSWNPISGCYHDCEYCYARTTANRFKGCIESPDGTAPDKIIEIKERLQCIDSKGNVRGAAYPYGFTPTFHEYRLEDPVTKGFGKTIFVCSMADMFGCWVPDHWIRKIFEACMKAPNHRYLFLTKNPERYLELAKARMLPEVENFWYGTTATSPNMPYFVSGYHNTFLSIEPILEPFGYDRLEKPDLPDWVIFGAETGKRANKVVPERSWVEGAVKRLLDEGKPVFMKDSMKPIWGEDILTQFPWDD